MRFTREKSLGTVPREFVLDPFYVGLLQQVKASWLLMLLVFSGVIFLSLVFVLLSPKKYESHMKILVTNARPAMILTPTGNQEPTLPGDSELRVNSEAELLANTDLLRRVVEECFLANPASQPVGSVDEKKLERSEEKLRRDLKIEPLRKTNLIEVSYSSKDPQLTVRVLNTLASDYLAERLDVQGASQPYAFFAFARDAAAQRLREARQALSVFQQEHPLTIGQQQEALIRERFETEAELRDTTKTLLEDRAREKFVGKAIANHSIAKTVVSQTRSVPNLYLVQQLNTMLAELQNRKIELLNKYNSNDRLVLQVEEQINTTQKALTRAEADKGEEESTDRNPVYATNELEEARAKLDVAGLEEREKFLEEQAKSDEAALVELQSEQSKMSQLQQAVIEAQKEDDIYEKKQGESQMSALLDKQKIEDVAVVEKPVLTYIPSSPQVGLDLAVGFLFALCASFGSSFVAKIFHGTRQTVEIARGS
jgi:uncharacterized protein involved in exopolysaccharide biosynthesis